MPSANDNRWPCVPIPAGGFATNAAEADWLAATITNRVREGLAGIGITVQPEMRGLRELLLLSLNAASRRKEQTHDHP